MLRRVIPLGLLFVSACFPEPVDLPDSGTSLGTVKGTLTPFRLQSTSSATAWPEPLRDPALRRRLSASLSRARDVASARRESALVAEAEGGVDAIAGEVIVRFEEGGLSASEVLARAALPGYRAEYKGALTGHLHLIGYAPRYPGLMKASEPGALARDVAAVRGVRSAEPNLRLHAFKTPTDPFYARQWHYRIMNLPAAWDTTTGSASVAIGIIDSGIVKHPDLDTRVVPGADFISDVAAAGDGDGRDMDPTDKGKDQPDESSSWHGSHVAGTIGAVTNEGRGVAGVTWVGPLVPVRALGKDGGALSDIAAGIQWAVGRSVPGFPLNKNPVKVINMSLGGEGPPSAALQEVIDDAVNNLGVIFVVAAGNSNANASRFTPCNQNNVICVGATRFNGKRASYSNFGTNVDVMATGGEMSEDLDGDGRPDGVFSTVLDKDGVTPAWTYYQGTSMAAPHVAGIVALMKARNPALTSAQVESMLIQSSDPASQCAEGCGAGLINAQTAVLLAKDGLNPSAPAKLGVGATQISFPGPGTQSLTVRNLGGGSLSVKAEAGGAFSSTLSFPGGGTLTVPAYGAAALPVAVNTAGLARGSYTAQLTLTSNGGTEAVAVKIQVGSVEDKDIILAFFFENDEGKLDLEEEEGVAVVTAAQGYAYSQWLTPRSYLAIATIDEDDDQDFFEDGERLGVWRDPANIELIKVEQGQTISGINFALVPTESSSD